MTRFPLSWSRRPVALLLASLLAPAALTLAAPAASAASSPACSGPSGNGFYQPPSPLPGGPHGDVIRCRAVASPTSGARAWRILYKSTTAAGAATAVSGTLLVPDAAYQGTRPVVAYASGTQGWGDQCAPSREMAAG
ncbi:MAG TPA: triacylglycerol lipase, partial [Streptosporangiaceae bacterium]|nr:triacylglycerol lipase [Streptosporangiaceae bacterium]